MAINEVTSIDVKTLPPFKRLIMTLGELPTSYLESMTYAELLMWFCNFLQEKVLPTIDNNAEALQDVITYLENLDLQDEVDHKLDEMTEEGTLQEIIADYLNSKAIFGFDNVQAMKEATNLINGSYAKTLGFNSINDAGGSLYKIRTITNDDIVNEKDIISLNDNTLIAVLVNTKSYVIPEQFGAYGDYNENETYHDDKNSIQRCIDYATEKSYNIQFLNKTYYISNTIYLRDNNPNINGNNCTIKSDTTNAIISMENGTVLRSAIIENINIVGSNSSENSNIGMNVIAIYTTFRQLSISYVAIGFKMFNTDVAGNLVGNRYENIGIRYCNVYSMYLGDNDNNKITDGWILNCTFGGDVTGNHLRIGSCAGYKINNIHTWGGGGTPLYFRNTGRTNIEGLYIETFKENCIFLHMARDCNISNVTAKVTEDNTTFIYCPQSSQNRDRNINLNNIFLDTNDEEQPTGFKLFDADYQHNVNVNIINFRNNITNYTLKPSNRPNIIINIYQDKITHYLTLNDIDTQIYSTLTSFIATLDQNIYVINGISSALANFTDMPTSYTTNGYTQFIINKGPDLTNTSIQMFNHASGNQYLYIGYYTTNSATAMNWKQITLS